MTSLSPIRLDDAQAARRRIAPHTLSTPLIRWHSGSSNVEIYLKLENLQPTGSFKVRGAVNSLRLLSEEAHRTDWGVWTASAGNMGSALAWSARRLGIPCAVIVPDDAPQAKRNAIARYGAQIYPVPFALYQEVQRKHDWRGLIDLPETGPLGGQMVHPFAGPAVMAGNATIGLEILEQLPDVGAIFIPYGGGGLSCGIASTIRAAKPDVNVYACEVETASPLAASWAAGEPVTVPYTASFVSGMGAPFVFPEMWPLARQLLDGVRVVGLSQVRHAIRSLAEEHHIIAEGAGVVSLAAALAEPAMPGKVVCLVSGGNIDRQVLIDILQEGEVEE
jgi:threonine dehydratase